MSRLVFSLVPLSQGLWGCAKNTSTPVPGVRRWWGAISGPWSQWGCAQVVDGLFMRLLSRPLGVVRIRWGFAAEAGVPAVPVGGGRARW